MILGIECTAHTFGVGIVHKGKILANVRDMFKTEQGGIIPMEAARHHKEVSEKIYEQAVNEAKIDVSKIEAIAVSNAPGLAPCLYEGMKFAKELSKRLGKPLIGINHCVAHLEIGQHEGAKDPVLLYSSGANTQIIAFASGKYRVFGETLDLGIGNFIDKVARHLGMGFPGGPKIEQEALKSSENDFIELPYSIKGMDVSFSGMQTKVQQLYDKAKKEGKNLEKIKSDLAFSLQETAFAMLVEAAERALAHTGKKELVLGGGVASNKRLQEMCKIMCRGRGARYYCPKKELLMDNGAMIAYTGEIMFKSRKFKENIEEVEVKPRERTDQVNVFWR